MVQLAPGARLTPQSFASAKSPATAILLSVSWPPPELASVTACAALDWPCCCAANTRLAGDSVTPGIAPATPLPPSKAICGLPGASSRTVSWPVRAPVVEGRKLTRIAQLAPAASADPQSLVWVKSPLATMDARLSAAALKFASVTVWVMLAAPTVCSPKISLSGDSTTPCAAAAQPSAKASASSLPEGEGEGLHAGIEELDLEGAVFNRPLLAHQLIEAMKRDRAQALSVGVGAMVRARGGAVNGDLEADGLAVRRAQHQVEIPGVEAIDDRPVGLFQNRHLRADFPGAGKTPLIVRGANRRGVGRGFIGFKLLRRGKAHAAAVADVGFRRPDGGHVGRGLGARTSHLHQSSRSAHLLVVGVGEELLDDALVFGVLALPEMVEADLALGIHKVIGRPVLIVECVPDRMVAVHRDREGEL